MLQSIKQNIRLSTVFEVSITEKLNHYIQSYASGLPENLIQVFENIETIRVFEKNAVIYNQDEEAHSFYYLKKGRVKIFITSENGMEKTLTVIGKGAILGEAAFFDEQPRISSAKAMLKCELVSIDKNILMDIIRKNPHTAMELFKLQAQTIRMLSAQVDSITFLHADSRIAKFLLESMHKNNKNYTVNATHEEIASVAGVSRVTVSKLMTQLSRKNIVKTGYKTIVVLKPEELKKLL